MNKFKTFFGILTSTGENLLVLPLISNLTLQFV